MRFRFRRRRPFNFKPLPNYGIGSRVVFFFTVATNHKEAITFRADINGQQVLSYTVPGGIFTQSIHEIVQAGLIAKGQNTIDFNVNVGRIDISDVLIMVGAMV